MEIYPAIDLHFGEVVRLTQGDYQKVEVYSDDPAEIAGQFLRAGAQNLHVVDLDGAREGWMVNESAIRSILKVGGLFVQVGGGIRDEDTIRQYLKLGVNRVILGTVAVEDFSFVQSMIEKYGDKIAVSVDARDGKIAVRGWIDKTDLDSFSFCQKLDACGISTIIYTDIARDGAMKGTNLDAYMRLSKLVKCNIIASGGVSSMDEIFLLAEMGVHGAILGKALYTGALDLGDVMAQC